MSAFGGFKQVDILSPGQKGVLGRLTSQVADALGAGTGSYKAVGIDPYAGQITPEANFNQLSAFEQAIPTLSPTPGMQSTLQNLLSGAGDPAAVRQMYSDQLIPSRLAFDDYMRDVRNRYGDTYGKTGALPYMEALAGARYGASQDQLLSDLVYQDRQSAADRSLNAITAGSGMNLANASNLGQLADIGSMQRNIGLQQNAEDYQKWAMSQPYNNPWLQLIGPVLGTQTKGQQEQSNVVGGIGSLLSGIGSIAGGFG